MECRQPCVKQLSSCGHRCQALCSQPCPPCSFQLVNKDLPCGHTLSSVKCSVWYSSARDDIVCHSQVAVIFPFCQHEGLLPCLDARQLQQFTGTVGTVQPVRALLTTDEDHPAWRCRKQCGGIREDCGHLCRAECGSCLRHTLLAQPSASASLPFTAVVHSRSCNHICGRAMVCGHECSGICHKEGECPPCARPCARQCSHSKCSRRCHEPCSACAQPCQWQHTCGVEEGGCPMPCGAACTRQPCDRRCAKLLSCGHRCVSVCGEQCPGAAFCKECAVAGGTLARSNAMQQMVDLVMQTTLAEHDIDDSPLIVLPCQHAFTIDSMDGVLAMHNYYTRDEASGSWQAPRDIRTLPPDAKPISVCPHCRSPIRNVHRYGRVLNRLDLDVMQKKFTVHITHRATQLRNTQHQLECELTRSVEQNDLAEERKETAMDEQTTRRQKAKEDSARQAANQQLLKRIRSHRFTTSQVVKTCREDNPVLQVYEMEKAYWADRTEEAATQAKQTNGVQADRDTMIDPSSAQAVSITPLLVLPTAAPLIRCLERCCQSQALLLLGLCHLVSHDGAIVTVLPRPDARVAAERKPAASEEADVQKLLAQLTNVRRAGDEWITLCTDSLSRTSLRAASFDLPLALVRCMIGLLHRRRSVSTSPAKAALMDAVKEVASALLASAERLSTLPALSADELDSVDGIRAAVERALRNDSPFYQKVSAEEKAMVFRVMSAEVGGAAGGWNGGGHWFTCQNGHVYTIGECGGAMQQSHCMECGAPVGGGNHQLVAGGRADIFLHEVQASAEAVGADGFQLL